MKNKVTFYIYRKSDQKLMKTFTAHKHSEYVKLLEQMKFLNPEYFYKSTGVEKNKRSMSYRQKITLKYRMPKFGKSV